MGRPPKYTQEESRRVPVGLPMPIYRKLGQIKEIIKAHNPYTADVQNLVAIDAAFDIALIVMNDPRFHKAVIDQLQARKADQEYDLLPRTVSTKNRSPKQIKALDDSENKVSTGGYGRWGKCTRSLAPPQEIFFISVTPKALKQCARMEEHR